MTLGGLVVCALLFGEATPLWSVFWATLPLHFLAFSLLSSSSVQGLAASRLGHADLSQIPELADGSGP